MSNSPHISTIFSIIYFLRYDKADKQMRSVEDSERKRGGNFESLISFKKISLKLCECFLQWTYNVPASYLSNIKWKLARHNPCSLVSSLSSAWFRQLTVFSRLTHFVLVLLRKTQKWQHVTELNQVISYANILPSLNQNALQITLNYLQNISKKAEVAKIQLDP